SSRAAQYPRSRRRTSDLRCFAGDLRRSVPRVPRTRCAAADPELGAASDRGIRIHPHVTALDRLSGGGDLADAARDQLHRRRATRRPRPLPDLKGALSQMPTGKETRYLTASTQNDGDISIPIATAVGSDEGPTLLVVAGVHGSEYVGIEAT